MAEILEYAIFSIEFFIRSMKFLENSDNGFSLCNLTYSDLWPRRIPLI